MPVPPAGGAISAARSSRGVAVRCRGVGRGLRRRELHSHRRHLDRRSTKLDRGGGRVASGEEPRATRTAVAPLASTTTLPVTREVSGAGAGGGSILPARARV